MNQGRSDPLPVHRLDVPALDVPFATGSFDSIGPLSRASFPHRHTFYEIVFVTSGEGAHVIDFAERPLSPPHLFFINPGQVHFWSRVGHLYGRLVLFTEEFLLAHPGDRDLLAGLGERPWLDLDPGEASRTASLMTQMEREHRRRDEGFATILQSYLHVLIVRAGRLPGAAAKATAADRASVVTQQFTRMLSQSGRNVLPVPSYAERIGVSASYLNEVVKEVTGRTPGKLIREVQVLEAKRLLARTGLTVAQISRELDFGDPAYFCRFFRRETGRSPGDFRRTAGENHHDHRVESIDGP